jgi:NAD(P)-dependent dehydrogenase (short-subunit alcohol dehydrogenase family)
VQPFVCSFNPALRTGLIRVHSGQESRTAPDRELEERVNSYVLDDLDNLFAQIKREKGRLDIVYANAGGGSFAPIGAITEQHFDQTFDTNVKGTLFTVQKALPLVPDGGSIIMTASTAGSTAMPAFSVYSASKAAIRSLPAAGRWI